MPQINFDIPNFNRKANLIRTFDSSANNRSAFFVISEELPATTNLNKMEYCHQTSAFFIWLFGYDIPNTIFVFSFEKNGLRLYTKDRKHAYLEEMLPENETQIKVRFLEDFETDLMNEVFGTRENALYIMKEKGGLSSKTIGLCRRQYKLLEAAREVNDLFAVKSDNEIANTRKAASLCNAVYTHYIVPEIETTIDEDVMKTHRSLSDSVKKVIQSPSKVKIDLDPRYVESCYDPLIQSGGEYTVDGYPKATQKPLDCGGKAPVLISLGLRYKSYCCNLARTLLFNPSEGQKRVYETLCEAFEKAKSSIKVGGELRDVWLAARKVVEAKMFDLRDRLGENGGSSIGIQFQDSILPINKKNSDKIREGMLLNLNLRLGNLKDAISDTPYAVQIADTILTTKTGAESLTTPQFDLNSVSYAIEKLNRPRKNDFGEEAPNQNGRSTTSRKRKAASCLSINEDEKIKAKRARLLDRMARNALENKTLSLSQKKKEPPRLVSFHSSSSMPSVTFPNKIYTDFESSSILLPFSGILVPIHIQNIKTLQISRDQKLSLLQITFKTCFAERSSFRIKEVVFRSRNSKNFENVIRNVREMKNDAKKSAEMNLESDSASLQDIVLLKDRSKTPRINKLKVRPAFAGKRGSVGTLEAHKNGFLFTLTSSKLKTSKIHILYDNVANAFFQPAKNTLSVIIHFHLKTARVMSKKTKDVQFYIDVVETSQNIELNARSDQDAIREEQKELEYKRRLNRIFKDFVKGAIKTAAQHGKQIRFDIPSDESKFIGVPEKSTVNIYQTKECLVSIEEYPPFVLPLKNVEIAHFERVQFQLKHFDLVFILKDLKNYRRIDAIPINYLAQLRQYLSDSNIVYFTGSVNLDWDRILREINSDLQEFWQNGGWRFLDAEKQDELDSELNSQSASEGEDFVPSSEESDSSSDSEEEDSEND